MIPAMRIIRNDPLNACNRPSVRLWKDADDVLEYWLKIGVDGQDHYDLHIAANLMQAAAVYLQNDDKIRALEALKKAAIRVEDLDVKADIYRLIASMGWGCQAHREQTILETTGGMHFAAGEVWDDIEDHLYCAFCGEEILDISSLATSAVEIENTPILF